jgi:hypothetical protein
VEVIGRLDGLEEAGEEVEVHSADELALLLGEAVERAIGERDLLIATELGFVALPGEGRQDRPSSLLGAGAGRRRGVARL